MMRWMLFRLIAASVLLGIGLYLLWFTPAATGWGIEVVVLAVTLITLGVFLLVPAKTTSSSDLPRADDPLGRE